MSRRLPGVLYLTVILTGLFSLGYVPSRLFASNDPVAILTAVRDGLPLLRWGIAAGMVCYIAFLLLPLALHRWLSPAGPTAAALMVGLAAVSVPLSLTALGHRMEILALAEGRGAFATWDAATLEAAVALAEQRFDATLRLAMLFWGLWLLPLGHLIVRSAQWPRVLGVLLLLGGTGYVVAVLGSVLSPAFSSSRVPGWLVLPATIGEFGTCLALLIRPPREPRASSA